MPFFLTSPAETLPTLWDELHIFIDSSIVYPKPSHGFHFPTYAPLTLALSCILFPRAAVGRAVLESECTLPTHIGSEEMFGLSHQELVEKLRNVFGVSQVGETVISLGRVVDRCCEQRLGWKQKRVLHNV